MSIKIKTKQKTAKLFDYLENYLEKDFLANKKRDYFTKNKKLNGINVNDLEIGSEVSFSYLQDNWKAQIKKIEITFDTRHLVKNLFKHKNGVIDVVSIIEDKVIYGVKDADSKLHFIDPELIYMIDNVVIRDKNEFDYKEETKKVNLKVIKKSMKQYKTDRLVVVTEEAQLEIDTILKKAVNREQCFALYGTKEGDQKKQTFFIDYVDEIKNTQVKSLDKILEVVFNLLICQSKSIIQNRFILTL